MTRRSKIRSRHHDVVRRFLGNSYEIAQIRHTTFVLTNTTNEHGHRARSRLFICRPRHLLFLQNRLGNSKSNLVSKQELLTSIVSDTMNDIPVSVRRGLYQKFSFRKALRLLTCV